MIDGVHEPAQHTCESHRPKYFWLAAEVEASDNLISTQILDAQRLDRKASAVTVAIFEPVKRYWHSNERKHNQQTINTATIEEQRGEEEDGSGNSKTREIQWSARNISRIN